MPEFHPFKSPQQSQTMSKLLPFIFILIPVFLALWFCEWQVVVSFFIGIIIVPVMLIFLFHLYEILFLHKRIDLNGAFEIGALYSVVGLPIYFIFILPVYYALKSFSFSLVYSFPVSISVIMFLFFMFVTTKPWGYKEFLVIVACSLIHSYFIIWLISKLKSFTL